MKNIFLSVASLGLFICPTVSHAQVITEGFTFAIADGNHFHSSTGGEFGNPSGKAEVGRFAGEVVHGLSEYDLTGLSNSPTAFVTFNVFKDGGLFPGTNDVPFRGTISIYAYEGNNSEDLSDFFAPSIATVGSFAVAPGATSVGDVFSFDISGIFNSAIDNGWSSLGIRLEQDPLLPDSQAWTFDTFRLTTDNQTMGGVPEPSTWLMLIVGFGAIGGTMRRQRAKLSLSYS